MTRLLLYDSVSLVALYLMSLLLDDGIISVQSFHFAPPPRRAITSTSMILAKPITRGGGGRRLLLLQQLRALTMDNDGSRQPPSSSTHNLFPESTPSDFVDGYKSEMNEMSTYMPMGLLPPKENWEANSTRRLSRIEMQKAMTKLKRFVERRLETDLNVFEHTAPIAFTTGTGVNDELDGSKSKAPVKFVIPNQYIPRGIEPKLASELTPEEEEESNRYTMDCEVVQSLAKWKRIMLGRLGVDVGEGIYCSSTSIRKGYKGDVTHSAIADQWDYEVRIRPEDRKVETLKRYVKIIWNIITDAEDYILNEYPQILLPGHPTSSFRLPKEITFITAEELHAKYPTLDVHGREDAAVCEYRAIFIVGMGWPMKDGSPPEEVRAPAYDDWNLNGDIIVMHPLLGYRHELSSMGIRVDAKSIVAQLKHRGMEDQVKLPFNHAVIHDQLPYSYGGGIGISRLLMLLLRTCHIGEVQCGLWHDEHYKQVCGAPGVDLIPDRIVDFLKP